MVSYGLLQGCAAGMFGRVRVCTGRCSAGSLFWGSVLAPRVVVPGVLLEVPSSLVAVACALPGVVLACCAYPVRRCGAPGLVVSAGALGVGCAGGSWRGFASCRVLCVLFCYCVLLLTVRIVCSRRS